MSSFRVSQMRHGSRRLPEDVNPISELDATSWPEYLDATRGIARCNDDEEDEGDDDSATAL